MNKDNPIAGPYPVDPEGAVDLGDPYGKVPVLLGLTLPEAKAAIEDRLKEKLKEPKTEIYLADSRATQQIRGRHLIRPDGTISLGEYGSVNLSGLTILEAKHTRIEDHLRQFLKDPEVMVDVLAYNSKVYYVILDGGFRRATLPPARDRKRNGARRPWPGQWVSDCIRPRSDLDFAAAAEHGRVRFGAIRGLEGDHRTGADPHELSSPTRGSDLRPIVSDCHVRYGPVPGDQSHGCSG